eukprot:52143_4
MMARPQSLAATRRPWAPTASSSSTRLSDSKVLLTEKDVRTLAPTTTVPPLPGFFFLALSFEAVEGERIYGLGQHAAFSWDPDYPAQLDQKGVPNMLLEPHDGDITIPVVHSSLGYAFLSNLPLHGQCRVQQYWLVLAPRCPFIRWTSGSQPRQ